MSFIEPDSFNEKEASLIYVAGEVGEAGSIEKLLTEIGIDYTVAHTPFLREMLFDGLRELPGVGFYVLAEQANYCREMLRFKGYKAGIVLVE